MNAVFEILKGVECVTVEAEASMTKKMAFEQALQTLEGALPYAKKIYQADLFQAAARLMDEKDGMKQLYEFVNRFDQAGVYEGGPWAEPAKLEPRFVKGSLMDSGLTSIVDILSELRMVAIAKGKYKHESVSMEDAKQFLDSVMALNVDSLFPEETEAARIEGKTKEKNRAEQLFQDLQRKARNSQIHLIIESN